MGDEKLLQKAYRKCGDYFSEIAFSATQKDFELVPEQRDKKI